jgi:hypothetical protein
MHAQDCGLGWAVVTRLWVLGWGLQEDLDADLAVGGLIGISNRLSFYFLFLFLGAGRSLWMHVDRASSNYV